MMTSQAKDVVKIGDLSLNSTKDSNLFLRALWAVLHSRYERLGWNYTPRRSGEDQRISFGWMSLGLGESGSIGVSIEYKNKGIIENICFEIEDCKDFLCSELSNGLQDAVTEAKRNMTKPIKRKIITFVTTSTETPLAAYRGQNWWCLPVKGNLMEIGIDVLGFDEADRGQEFIIRLDKLLDALSFMTNALFIRAENLSATDRREPESVNTYLIEEDWLDDYSIEDEKLRLSHNQVQYCDRLVDDMVADEQSIKAARLFHSGLRLSKQTEANNDTAETLFISAIEAISLSRAEKKICETCNQSIFSISQRVSEVTNKHLGAHIAKKFRQEYYNNRSKFLHTGHVRASQPIEGRVFPQLDPSGVEGCSVPTPFGASKSLLEFTSFILRREIEIITGL